MHHLTDLITVSEDIGDQFASQHRKIQFSSSNGDRQTVDSEKKGVDIAFDITIEKKIRKYSDVIWKYRERCHVGVSGFVTHRPAPFLVLKKYKNLNEYSKG